MGTLKVFHEQLVNYLGNSTSFSDFLPDLFEHSEEENLNMITPGSTPSKDSIV
jgi:hypothetical protein